MIRWAREDEWSMPAMMGTNDVAWASPVYWVGEENWLMLATIVVDDGDVG